MDRRASLRPEGPDAAATASPAYADALQESLAPSAKRPNILYIMSDDHAANAISCYGGILAEAAPTPNIDRIAAGGMRLDNCFCTNSICTPSRACILTGQYSHVNGVYTLGDQLDPKRQNVAKLLQRGGYQTAVIGKWHLKTRPTGFDYWTVLPGQGRYHDPVMRVQGRDDEVVRKGYSADVITDLSLDWLDRCSPDEPFFLLCHFKAPHRPWDPAERFAELYEDVTFPEPENLLDDYKNRSRAAANATLKVGEDMTERDVKCPMPVGLDRDALRKWAYQRYMKDYLRCIAAIDENVGRLLDYLDGHNLADDTVVIYTSDQGMFLGEHGYYDKRFMYEESLRMPFVVRYPEEIPAGTVNDDIILNLDFAQTFLDYANLQPPSDMQGKSFRANLAGRTPPDWRAAMYYRYWMHQSDHGVPAHLGLRTKRYKLIFYYGLGLGMAGTEEFDPTEPEWELFDLAKDPREMNSVYADPAYNMVVNELKAELARLKEEFGDADEAYPDMVQVMAQHWER